MRTSAHRSTRRPGIASSSNVLRCKPHTRDSGVPRCRAALCHTSHMAAEGACAHGPCRHRPACSQSSATSATSMQPQECRRRARARTLPPRLLTHERENRHHNERIFARASPYFVNSQLKATTSAFMSTGLLTGTCPTRYVAAIMNARRKAHRQPSCWRSWQPRCRPTTGRPPKSTQHLLKGQGPGLVNVLFAKRKSGYTRGVQCLQFRTVQCRCTRRLERDAARSQHLVGTLRWWVTDLSTLRSVGRSLTHTCPHNSKTQRRGDHSSLVLVGHMHTAAITTRCVEG